MITGMSSVDAMESEHPYFAGRSGGTGTRPGNFALQNSDVLLSIGNRQGFAQTGFQYQDWARGSYTILNDIDENELKKPSLHVSLPVCGDAGDLIRKLICAAKLRGADETNPLFKGRDWIRQCQVWKQKYPVVTAKHYETVEEGCTNIYAFMKNCQSNAGGADTDGQCGNFQSGRKSGISGKKRSAFYYKSKYCVYGILSPGSDRNLCRTARKTSSLCDR